MDGEGDVGHAGYFAGLGRRGVFLVPFQLATERYAHLAPETQRAAAMEF